MPLRKSHSEYVARFLGAETMFTKHCILRASVVTVFLYVITAVVMLSMQSCHLKGFELLACVQQTHFNVSNNSSHSTSRAIEPAKDKGCWWICLMEPFNLALWKTIPSFCLQFSINSYKFQRVSPASLLAQVDYNNKQSFRSQFLWSGYHIFLIQLEEYPPFPSWYKLSANPFIQRAKTILLK